MGDVISLGDWTLAVLGWSTSPQLKGFSADAGKKYALVDVFLFNRGPRQTNQENGTRLRDAAGQEYGFNGPSPFSAYFKPGEKARGLIPIQIPQASNPAVFMYRMSDSNQDYVSIDLGAAPVSLDLPAELRLAKADSADMGQALTRGDITFAVVGWRLSEGNAQSKPAPGTKLVVADVIVRNQGKAAMDFSPRNRSAPVRARHAFLAHAERCDSHHHDQGGRQDTL